MQVSSDGNAIVFVEDMIFGTSTNSHTREVAMSLQLNGKPLEILFSKEQLEIMIREFNKWLPDITYSTPITVDEGFNGGSLQ